MTQKQIRQERKRLKKLIKLWACDFDNLEPNDYTYSMRSRIATKIATLQKQMNQLAARCPHPNYKGSVLRGRCPDCGFWQDETPF